MRVTSSLQVSYKWNLEWFTGSDRHFFDTVDFILYDKVRLGKHFSCRVQFGIVFESAVGEQRLCLIELPLISRRRKPRSALRAGVSRHTYASYVCIF